MTMVRGGAVAISAIAAAIVLAGCTDETTGNQETLNFTESDKESQFTPIGDISENQGIPPGSGFALTIPLKDSSGETVGEINAVCIATKPGQNLNGTCTGTANVPDGQLAINVGGEIGDDTSGAIVGGTGKYTGAAGTFVSKSDGEGAEDTFTFTLP